MGGFWLGSVCGGSICGWSRQLLLCGSGVGWGGIDSCWSGVEHTDVAEWGGVGWSTQLLVGGVEHTAVGGWGGAHRCC